MDYFGKMTLVVVTKAEFILYTTRACQTANPVISPVYKYSKLSNNLQARKANIDPKNSICQK